MRLPRLDAILALATTGTALSLPNNLGYTVHEQRNVDSHWTPRGDERPDPRMRIPLRIGLVHSNLEQGHDMLMEISDPNHHNYGKHMSLDQIADFFAPKQESIDAVRDWLLSSGIDKDRIRLSGGRNWLTLEADLQEVESLLKTEYKMFDHESGHERLACDEYSIPQELSSHVDLITPTIHFDIDTDRAPVNKKRSLRTRSPEVAPANDPPPLQPVGPPPHGPSVAQVDATAAGGGPTYCGDYMTPVCVRALYGIPKGDANLTTFGVYAHTNQYYQQSDLDSFFSYFSPNVPNGTAPLLKSIDGGEPIKSSDLAKIVEPNLDFEYAMSLVYPQTTFDYQVGDNVSDASFGNFLDAFDASFCTYAGGDDYSVDFRYPDPKAGGYKKQDCGTFAPAAVISVSYSYEEAVLSPAYMRRQCYEYMKLGMAGTSFFFSSGDSGVGGAGGRCCVNPRCAGATFNKGDSGTFNPKFPSTCPYITSVGATRIKKGNSYTDPEVAADTQIYSGGGFSNVFPVPDYQATTLSNYFQKHLPPYTAAQYNNSQQVRGFPDVSANGVNEYTYQNGNFYLTGGTSVSAPIFASIIVHINNKRAKKKKPSVGFLNPVLYANPQLLIDIKSGRNPGCGTQGFESVEGWDPVTGLGTPNFTALAEYFDRIP